MKKKKIKTFVWLKKTTYEFGWSEGSQHRQAVIWYYRKCTSRLKGTVQWDFWPTVFFHNANLHGLKYLQFWLRICQTIQIFQSLRLWYPGKSISPEYDTRWVNKNLPEMTPENHTRKILTKIKNILTHWSVPSRFE